MLVEESGRIVYGSYTHVNALVLLNVSFCALQMNHLTIVGKIRALKGVHHELCNVVRVWAVRVENGSAVRDNTLACVMAFWSLERCVYANVKWSFQRLTNATRLH